MIMLRGSRGTGCVFEPGDVVRHRRYGYRGVIVNVDATCRADEDWYWSNQTQPSRDQPWCHVLVHDGTHTTYAAAANLEPEPEPAPVDHPLVGQFFAEFRDGRYIRNDETWSG